MRYAAVGIGSNQQHVLSLQVLSGPWPRPFQYAPCLPVGECTYRPEVLSLIQLPSTTQNGALQHK